MCGIAGILNVAGFSSGCEVSSVQTMLQAQVHRGPDDTGLYNDRHVVLGHRRLSIIDLSPAGRQPLSNEDGTIWTICNGEIYNYRELRQELSASGHIFSSNSDTEVIIHGYEEWGVEALLDRLVGMFAFVIYQENVEKSHGVQSSQGEQKFELFLVRDRLGEKPLYYSWDGTQLVFASEVKALISSGLVDREIDYSAVQAYLMFGSIPAPLTIIKGVKSLEPATYVRLRRDSWEQKQYWQIEFCEDFSMSQKDVVDQLQLLLLESVKCRLISDVPLGVFLSGGIDSSSIVSLLNEVSDKPIRSYSLGFQESEFNEAHIARLVAKQFGTEHVEFEMTAESVFEVLPEIFQAMDQPTIDGVNTFLVSRLARTSGEIVAISGLGGDELFGGYPSFKQVPQLFRFSRMINVVPGLCRILGTMLALGPKWTKMEKLKYVLQNPGSAEAAYLGVRGLFLNGQFESVGGSDQKCDSLSPLESLQHLGAQSSDSDLRNMVSFLELKSYMHNQLLRDTDVMSMAHGLEVRVPFLDHRLVEFLATVPTQFKYTTHAKQLLLNAIPRSLPTQVTSQPKRGFTFPFDSWFRGKWRPYIEEILMAGNEGAIDARNTKLIWALFLKGQVHWSRIWCLVVLRVWLRQLNVEWGRVPDHSRP